MRESALLWPRAGPAVRISRVAWRTMMTGTNPIGSSVPISADQKQVLGRAPTTRPDRPGTLFERLELG